jgi:branched-chain amino acid transport system ATP-binding protein
VGGRVLNIRNLTSCYGKITALQNVSLHIWPGEIVSIIGANGAGKTTLINTISGIVRPASGSVTLEKKNITGMNPEEIVGLGLTQVPEGRQIFNSLSVLDNLRLGAYLRYRRGEKKSINKDIEEMFSLFPILGERLKQSAGTLSGGEQQMLAIARGLMAAPLILMFDEPSLGLAPKITNEIIEVITRLKEKGLTILLIEQNARAALSIADRGYVIETGNVIGEGQGKTLLSDGDVKRAYLGRDYHEFWE